MQNFSSLGLASELRPLLEERGISIPTPIQAQSIPLTLTGGDLIGIAQTGTGKTLAFGLPLIHQLLESNSRALILAPTRELATQITEVMRSFGLPLRLNTALLVGGAGMIPQIKDLKRGPRIIVATPGRLIDHVMRGSLRLGPDFKHLVLDEADRMLDLGFLPAIQRIISMLPRERQTLMFSATMPPSIQSLMSEHMIDPQRIEIAPAGTPIELVQQSAYFVSQDNKNDLLSDLVGAVTGPVLVFARTRHGARKTAKALMEHGHRANEIHSDRTQAQRDAAMRGFRNGDFRILVATDIAARGIDVKNIELVVQYDLPDDHDNYIHRIGRTGRAGSEGRAVILITPEHTTKFGNLERSIGFDIETAEDSPLDRPMRRGKGGRSTPKPRTNNHRDTPRPDHQEMAMIGAGPIEGAMAAEIPMESGAESHQAVAVADRPIYGSKNGASAGFKKREYSDNRDDSRPAYQSNSYQGNRDRPAYGQNREGGGGYQGNRDRPAYGQNREGGGGYQGNRDRPAFGQNREGGGGYQGNRDRPAYGQNREGGGGYQGNRDRPAYGQNREGGGGYQGNRDRPAYGQNREGGGGYQGNRDRPAYGQNRDGGGGYQGNRDRPAYGQNRDGGGGYQGNRDRPAYGQNREGGGYQGNRGDRPQYNSGYQGNNHDGRPAYGENREAGAEKRPYGDRDSRPAYGKPAYGKPAYGNKPAYGKPSNGKPAYGKPSGGYQGNRDDRPSFGKPAYGKPAGKPYQKREPSFLSEAPKGNQFVDDRPAYGGSSKPANRPNSAPKAFRGKPGKHAKGAPKHMGKATPSNGFQPPKKKRK